MISEEIFCKTFSSNYNIPDDTWLNMFDNDISSSSVLQPSSRDVFISLDYLLVTRFLYYIIDDKEKIDDMAYAR